MCTRFGEIPFRELFVSLIQFHLLMCGDTCWYISNVLDMEPAEHTLYAVVFVITTYLYFRKELTNHIVVLFFKIIHSSIATIITVQKDIHESIRRVVYYPMIIYIWMTTFILMRICQKMWKAERKPILIQHGSVQYESIQHEQTNETFNDYDSGYPFYTDDELMSTRSFSDYSYNMSEYASTRSDSSLDDDEIPEVVEVKKEQVFIDPEVGSPTIRCYSPLEPDVNYTVLLINETGVSDEEEEEVDEEEEEEEEIVEEEEIHESEPEEYSEEEPERNVSFSTFCKKRTISRRGLISDSVLKMKE